MLRALDRRCFPDWPHSGRPLHHRVHEPPPDVRTIDAARNIPPGLADLTHRLLRKDPESRPQSADEVRRALTAFHGSRGAEGELHSLTASTLDRPDDSLPYAEPVSATAFPSAALPASDTGLGHRETRRSRWVTLCWVGAALLVGAGTAGGLWSHFGESRAGEERPAADVPTEPLVDAQPPADDTRSANCTATNACAKRGQCSEVAGHCVATSDADRRRSQGCAGRGRCTALRSVCAAASAEDCQDSKGCGKYGLCSLLDGQCLALQDHDCAGSTQCRRNGLCTARGGRCVASAP